MANDMQVRLAVLIDADNASAKCSDRLFEEVDKLGTATVRRAYGDFSKGQAKSWVPALIKHAIVPQQQFANVPGKNATDFALVIDAMDMLHAGGLDAFCIVSSDSDFTRLATRIREHGLEVFGFGRKDAAESFRRACREFVDIDKPVSKPAAKPASATPARPAKAPPVEPPKHASSTALEPNVAHAPVAEAERLILRALGEAGAGGKWVAIATVISEVRKLDPAFRPQNYGSGLFSELVERTSCLEGNREGGRCTQIRMIPKGMSKPATKAARPSVTRLATGQPDLTPAPPRMPPHSP
ncbi:MAG: NYN domain-containing protein [Hyphomicrobiales bacterium]|nr:MAG: NYN domain-containing protein [Hyphomicrobiales bacterium]